MFSVLQTTLELIGRERRWRWVLLVALAVVSSLLEMTGAVLVFLLIALVADPTGGFEIPFIGRIEPPAGTDDTTFALGLVAVLGVFFVFRAAFTIWVGHVQNRIANRTGAHLSKRLADGYLGLPYEFHLGRNTAESIRNANAAATQFVTEALIPMIDTASATILTLGLLIVLLVVSPVATVLAVAVIGGAVALLMAYVQPHLKRLGAEAHRLNEETLRSLQQSLQGLRDIKLFGREAPFARQYGRGIDRLARTAYLRSTVGSLPRAVMDTAIIMFILAFFAIALLADTATTEVLSILGLFAYTALRLQPSLGRVVGGLNELKYASAAIDGIHEDIQLIDGARPVDVDVPVRPFCRAVRFEQVSFRYEGADSDALSDVGLGINRGESIGICGPTGGGKSTLADLLVGLLTPTSGRVTIDGSDLQDDVRGWQRNLGVVSQMAFLIDDSIRANVALGIPEHEQDEDAIREAVELAQLGDFIAGSPAGLDTIVGEGGIRVSGGQRQRIAVARALYRRAEVLVLDEGTSALDNATEAALMAALQRLRGRRTIVLVAHRLSTVRGCDRIVYIEDGRIAGVGPYDELAATNPGFRALARTS